MVPRPSFAENVAHAHLNRPASQQKDRWWCVVEILYAVADLIARANRAGIEPPESSRRRVTHEHRPLVTSIAFWDADDVH